MRSGRLKRPAFLGMLAMSLIWGRSTCVDAGTIQLNTFNPVLIYGTYDSTYESNQAGSFHSVINGQANNFVYCVQFFTPIDPYRNSYTANFTSNGSTNGASVSNAGQIVGMLDHYAASAAGNNNLEAGLQAAIWHLAGFGHTFNLDTTGPNNSAALISAYQNDLAGSAGHSDPLSNLIWIDPYEVKPSGFVKHLQGLVAIAPASSTTQVKVRF